MHCKLITLLLVAVTIVAMNIPSSEAAETETTQQSMGRSLQFRAGWWMPATKSYEKGTGVELAYAVVPLPYAALEAGLGYYRAESYQKNESANTYRSSFISAIPLTLSARAILPLPLIRLHAGGGVGLYYKMAKGAVDKVLDPKEPAGLTELPAEKSEFSMGYHVNAGFEFPATSGVSVLLNYKYVIVDQGKFKNYGDIKHGGDFLFAGFAANF